MSSSESSPEGTSSVSQAVSVRVVHGKKGRTMPRETLLTRRRKQQTSEPDLPVLVKETPLEMHPRSEYQTMELPIPKDIHIESAHYDLYEGWHPTPRPREDITEQPRHLVQETEPGLLKITWILIYDFLARFARRLW